VDFNGKMRGNPHDGDVVANAPEKMQHSKMYAYLNSIIDGVHIQNA